MAIYESDPSNLTLTVLRQFAGGPGPPENNLVRFGLPIIMWTILLVITWSRQRAEALPRERWLVWAFGVGLARETVMFGRTMQRIVDGASVESALFHPIEHTLSMTMVVVVAGAFLRYVLDAPLLARRFLRVGAIVTLVSLLIAYQAWPRQLAENPEIHFHQTWEAWIFHVPTSALIIGAIYFLIKRPGWLPKVVSTALFFFFMGEFLFLFNFATAAAYNIFLCPIANSFHILAIPVLGYIYLREQSVEKQRAEDELAAYRDHLEDLVAERTTELRSVNIRLATLHLASSKLTSTLDPDQVNPAIAEQSSKLLRSKGACIFQWEKQQQTLSLVASWGINGAKRRAVAELAAAYGSPPGPLSVAQPIVVSDTHNDVATLNEWNAILDSESLIYVPIWENEFTSTLLMVMDSTAGREWRSDELSIIKSFADRAAAALENAQLHQQLEWVAALEERQRIAANMHDGLAQTLSLLGLKVDQISSSFGTRINVGLMEELDGVRKVVQQASVEARRAIANLHQTSGPRQSLQDLLSETVTRVIDNDQLSTQIHMEMAEPLCLTSEENSRLVPIVQEMLVNALHHAQAAEITLSLQYDDGECRITVEDDGCGFDPQRPRVDEVGHFGLPIMRARAVQLNGRIEIDSELGQGTRIHLIWPVQFQNAESVEKAGADRKNHYHSAVSQSQTIEANVESQNRLQRGHYEEASSVACR